MANRERIIQAAAFVYAHHGFRGATTRRIAEAAGVNEITIFRQFGSKEALINEALSQMIGDPHALPSLPETPVDPKSELTTWCEAHLGHLRANRSMIRKSMAELEERPQAGPCTTRPNSIAGAELKRYMTRLYAGGFLAGSACRDEDEDRLAHAAGAMLMAALFGDAMGREVMPDLYPKPASKAASLYVTLFLRAMGCAESARDATSAPVDSAKTVEPATPAIRRRRNTDPAADTRHPIPSKTRK